LAVGDVNKIQETAEFKFLALKVCYRAAVLVYQVQFFAKFANKGLPNKRFYLKSVAQEFLVTVSSENQVHI